MPDAVLQKSPRRKPVRSSLFVWAGALAAAVALTGFAKTFFHPLITGTFSAHPAVYIHGVFLFGWVAFFIVQAVLVREWRVATHRRMGWIGLALAFGVVASTLIIGVLASQRIAAGGAVGQANSELLVILLEMTVFASLVTAAVLFRRRPETHKRLMLLALIGALGPAWFRFRHYFPAIENPVLFYSLLLADSVILLAIAIDLRAGRGFHPAYLYAGGAMVAVHCVEVFAFSTPAFQFVADRVAGPLV
jgi:hypothetical protein